MEQQEKKKKLEVAKDQPVEVTGFIVPIQLMNSIVEYIKKHPWDQVEPLMTAIRTMIKPSYGQEEVKG